MLVTEAIVGSVAEPSLLDYPVCMSGLRDGLQRWAIGLPMHVDWSAGRRECSKFAVAAPRLYGTDKRAQAASPDRWATSRLLAWGSNPNGWARETEFRVELYPSTALVSARNPAFESPGVVRTLILDRPNGTTLEYGTCVP